MKFQIVLIPRLMPDEFHPDIYEKLPNSIMKKINSRLKTGIGKKIVENSLYPLKMIKYKYNNGKINVIAETPILSAYTVKKGYYPSTMGGWIEYIKDIYGRFGPDTWMSGNINIINDDEYKYVIELGLDLVDVKLIG